MISDRVSRRARVCFVAAILLSCGDSGGDETIYPKDFRAAGYQLVRECRSPGEHSGISAFTVWVSPEAVGALEQLFASPDTTAMPAGSVLVKEVYGGSACEETDVDHWVAMAKEPGFDPEHGDWHWQEVSADGAIVVDGRDSACIGCHAGDPSTTCTGFGEMNGFDYVCTTP